MASFKVDCNPSMFTESAVAFAIRVSSEEGNVISMEYGVLTVTPGLDGTDNQNLPGNGIAGTVGVGVDTLECDASVPIRIPRDGYVYFPDLIDNILSHI